MQPWASGEQGLFRELLGRVSEDKGLERSIRKMVNTQESPPPSSRPSQCKGRQAKMPRVCMNKKLLAKQIQKTFLQAVETGISNLGGI